MNDFFSGEKLYGDDFTIDQIKAWYDAEKEGYADLGSKKKEEYKYGYHEFNKLHAFNKLNSKTVFNNALGIGSAYGNEFEPILDRINNITILEPSDSLMADKIGNIKPSYVKPELDGTLQFADNTFDLITCFGTLHHIANVSFVVEEILRVLKPGGYFLVREPIISMGDWNKPRQGLTKNERGIPVKIFDSFFPKDKFEIVNKAFCFTMTSFFQRSLGSVFKRPIYTYKSYLILDKYLSKLLAGNVHYHAQTKWQRCAPATIFYVVKKK